jgi:hypothetical protein
MFCLLVEIYSIGLYVVEAILKYYREKATTIAHQRTTQKKPIEVLWYRPTNI